MCQLSIGTETAQRVAKALGSEMHQRKLRGVSVDSYEMSDQGFSAISPFEFHSPSDTLAVPCCTVTPPAYTATRLWAILQPVASGL